MCRKMALIFLSVLIVMMSICAAADAGTYTRFPELSGSSMPELEPSTVLLLLLLLH